MVFRMRSWMHSDKKKKKNWERKAVFTVFSTSDSGPLSIWEFYTFQTFTKSQGHSSSLHTFIVQRVYAGNQHKASELCWITMPVCSTLAINEHQVKVSRYWFSGAAGRPLWGVQVVPASSQNDPLQGTAEPHSQGGSTLGKMCFRKGRA